MCIRISVVACDVSFVFTLFQFYVFLEHGDARVCFSSVSVLVSLRTAPPALPQRCRTDRNQVGTNLEPNGTSLCMEELGDGFSFVFVVFGVFGCCLTHVLGT